MRGTSLKQGHDTPNQKNDLKKPKKMYFRFPNFKIRFGTELGEPVAEVGVSQLLFEREQWAKYRALERILGHPDGAVLYAKSEGIGMGELAARMCMRGSDLVKG